MQKKIHSLIEAVTNTSIGLVINVAANQWIIFPILGVDPPLVTNVGIAVFFTVLSIVRGYTLRRLFTGGIIEKIINLYKKYMVSKIGNILGSIRFWQVVVLSVLQTLVTLGTIDGETAVAVTNAVSAILGASVGIGTLDSVATKFGK